MHLKELHSLNTVQVALQEKSSALLTPWLTLLLTHRTPERCWTGEPWPAAEGTLYQAVFQGGPRADTPHWEVGRSKPSVPGWAGQCQGEQLQHNTA